MSTQLNELPWVEEAKRYVGLSEIVGPKHNPTIVGWLKSLKSAWLEDETPWCGTFVANCLKVANRSIPKHWYRALAYSTYDTVLKSPAYGCIGTMTRKGGGHVVFVLGITEDKKSLVCIGGNQNNKVSITTYPITRFNAFVWPSKSDGSPSIPYPERFNLPVYGKDMLVKNNVTKTLTEA